MSMFTERLRNDRNPFDNWDIREQAADKIEALEERNEALEAALREIEDALGYAKNESKLPAIREYNAHSAWKIAQAALAPEQDK